MQDGLQKLCRKTKINYLKKNIEKGIFSSKQFWNFFKPFLTNKGCMNNDFKSIRNGDAFIDKESNLVEMSNSHYINIVEKTSRVTLKNFIIGTNNT